MLKQRNEGQMTDVREQTTEDRGQKTEVRGQGADDREQTTEDRGRKTEVRGQICHFGNRVADKKDIMRRA